MKTDELVRILKKDGWFLHRHGTRHDIYRHKSKEGQVPVPRHGSKEIPEGTLKSILELAGLK